MSKEVMKKLGDIIGEKIPKEFGFALLVFPFHSPGISNYISNAQRDDMIKALRETADRLEKRQDFPTPSEQAN